MLNFLKGTNNSHELTEKLNAVSRTQAIIEFDPTGQILDANDNFLQTVGYTKAEIVGRHHSMFMPEGEANRDEYRQFWAALGRGEHFVKDFRRVGKGNREIWINGSYNPLRDASGQVYKVVKFATDITEQKLMAAQNDAYVSAMDRSQAVIEFKMDGTILKANQNFLDAVGYSANEIVGQHHSMFAPPELKGSAEYRQFWEKLNRGEFDAGEYKRIAKGGREIWIQASYNPIFDPEGRPVKVVKFASDITEQKLSANNNTAYVDAIRRSQAVIEFKMDGTIIDANQNFLDAMGYSANEIIGQHHSMFAPEGLAGSPEYRQFWDKLNRGEFDSGEYMRMAKGGREIWIQASYNPILDPEGKPIKVVKFATDITAQKQQAVEAKRLANLSSALKLCQSNVMMADNDLNISYLNDSVKQMLRGNEPELRKVLPNFAVDSLIGQNVDVFHQNPAHQRSMLKALSSTHKTQIKVGKLSFSLSASPWLDLEGNRLGTLLEWVDRTAEVNIESEIDSIVDAASTGDFTKQISMEGKDGFFANLSQGLNNLVSTTEVALNDVLRVLGALAKGDLTERITREYQGSFGQLKDDANATAEKLTDVIANIRTSAGAISSAANEIAQGNADLSQRTEEQASSLEETASSMEEMTSTVRHSAENALQANSLSSEAQKKAEQGGAVVSRAVTAMEEINKSSKEIADIIGVIDEIAFQTNLLALNAAVEAARAGEQGRGFAVVAGEVRNLAQRSAGAAKEIKELIRDSQGKVIDGTDLVNQSGETLKEIVAAVNKVSNMMKEISDSAQEQTSGIEQVNTAVSQMDDMTQQNAALVEEASAAGEAMAEQARSMNNLMDFFTVGGMDSSSSSASSGHSAPRSAPRAAPKATSGGGGDDEWEEF